MAARDTHTVLAPLALHQTQIAAADATALDMARDNAAVPRVSRAWALRELATWGCAQLEGMLNTRTLSVMRALSPPRGAPRRSRDGATADATPFQIVPPITVERTLAARLRALAAGVTRVTGIRTTIAAVVREAVLVGYEARARAREEAERHAREQRALAQQAGVFDPSLIRAASVTVLVPYSPPGRKSGPADTPWGEPIDLHPRARPAASERSAKVTPSTVTKKTGRPRTNAASPAGQHGRSPRRRRSPSRTKPTGAGGDDEPAPPRAPRSGAHGRLLDARLRGACPYAVGPS